MVAGEQRQEAMPLSPGAVRFGARVDRLREKLASYASEGGRAAWRTEDLLGDLQDAYEELRVADEEIRTQHDQISHLVEGRQLDKWQHERMLAVLPVPVLTTDQHGTIRSVNAAGAWLAERRVARMIGKPVFGLFTTDDRSTVRRALARQGRDGEVFRETASVLHQSGEETKVDIVATAGDDDRVTWMLLTPAHDESAPTPQRLTDALVRLASLPFSVAGTREAVEQAAEICQSALGAGVTVSISMGDPRAPTHLSTTSPTAQAMDGAQLIASEGPCIDAFDLGRPVRTIDVRSDSRWSRLSRHVPPEVSGVTAAPLEVGEELVGSLNVYEIAPLDRDLTDTTDVLAVTVAAVLLELEARAELETLTEELRTALTSRATIDQAKGIVIAQLGCGPDEAFAHLVRLSSERHTKLRDLAHEIVDSAQSSRGQAPRHLS